MILVTGSTGLLGSYLIDFLLKKNQKVKALIRKESDEKQFNSNANLTFAVGNILDVTSLQDAFSDIEIVYHCAGFISFSPFDKPELLKINVEGTANVVNTCLHFNIKKLCHVSSVAAIGKSKTSDVTTETTVWDDSSDNSYYGFTKHLAELEVWRAIEEGLNAVIVNPSVILGYTKWSSPSMSLFKYVKNGNSFYTTGGSNFVDVNDVVQLMQKLVESEIHSERFIVAGKRIELKYLFELIANSLNLKPPNKLARKWMLNIAWRVEHIRAKFFNHTPAITKETAKISNRKHEYSSEKVIEKFNIDFTLIEETISWVCNQIKSK